MLHMHHNHAANAACAFISRLNFDQSQENTFQYSILWWKTKSFSSINWKRMPTWRILVTDSHAVREPSPNLVFPIFHVNFRSPTLICLADATDFRLFQTPIRISLEKCSNPNWIFKLISNADWIYDAHRIACAHIGGEGWWRVADVEQSLF